MVNNIGYINIDILDCCSLTSPASQLSLGVGLMAINSERFMDARAGIVDEVNEISWQTGIRTERVQRHGHDMYIMGIRSIELRRAIKVCLSLLLYVCFCFVYQQVYRGA
jgi:hypothetical protein